MMSNTVPGVVGLGSEGSGAVGAGFWAGSVRVDMEGLNEGDGESTQVASEETLLETRVSEELECDS